MHINQTNRRDFLGKITSAAALMTMGNLAAVAAPVAAAGQHSAILAAGPDEWLKTNIRGKHKVVVDAPDPASDHIFGAPKVILLGQAETGTSEKDTSILVVLRSEAIIFAMQDSLWEKYKFGETHKIVDPRTNAVNNRNPYWETKPDDFKFPGFGAVPIGIRDLQASGVLFCVCGVAITVHSAMAAQQSNRSEADVKKEWLDALIPGVQLMPSGVWATTRAQEYGCSYIPG
ncbi:twin-arginine translocation signal domain-containing protein [Chitinophaga agrisoli]|uniref:Twin-arginine translocation signal domain-containing protein n=1 Tax=Chitinophaga agrisoli TaxID=2607653 RepID=A0A5B2VPQ7_9BACT|nr:twin-arginine translocation signal domain-containing protein [Chitinophaga agrisoli]KAA2240700.1 twin-arginine translocation signal domain-containing protein [Chitinophaga agrisoli]